jgi:hypothetical protein
MFDLIVMFGNCYVRISNFCNVEITLVEHPFIETEKDDSKFLPPSSILNFENAFVNQFSDNLTIIVFYCCLSKAKHAPYIINKKLLE